jgi:hypothetical protein
MKRPLTAPIAATMIGTTRTQGAYSTWNIITLNSVPRVIFVEDLFKAEAYDTQNAVHWSLAEVNLQ